MVFGIGTDIVEVERIRKVMERDIGFRDKIFTPVEIAYCETKRFKYENYAARFSAKEAFLKAIGTGWRFGIRFVDIEVINDDLGKPNIMTHGKATELIKTHQITRMHVSLSHLKEMATAIVLLEND